MQFLKTGVPMVAFLLVGTWGLSRLNQGRYDDREREKKRLASIPEAKTSKKKEEFNLESEYQKMMKEIDLSKWEPKRVPRNGI